MPRARVMPPLGVLAPDHAMCTECRIVKPTAGFYKRLDGLSPECKPCSSARNGRATRARRLAARGLTPALYDQMLATQDGVCPGCEAPCSTGRRLAVDHDHASGATRGLLCRDCNLIIGLAKDNPERLARMIRYLAHHQTKKDGQ